MCCDFLFSEEPLFTSYGVCYVTKERIKENFAYQFSAIEIWTNTANVTGPSQSIQHPFFCIRSSRAFIFYEFEGFQMQFKGRNAVNREGLFYGISPQKEDMGVTIEKSNVIVPTGTYEHIGLSFQEVSIIPHSCYPQLNFVFSFFCSQIDRSKLGSKNCTSTVEDWYPMEGPYSLWNCMAWIAEDSLYKGMCNPSRYRNITASTAYVACNLN